LKYSDSSYYSTEQRLYHNIGHAMGTRLDIIIHGVEEEEGERAFGMAIREVRRIEKLLSRFDQDNPIATINRLGFKQSLTVDQELFGILLRCREYYELSKGIFDIGLGRVVTEIKEKKPSAEIIREMLRHSGFKNIRLEEGEKTVKFDGKYVELDFGGFGKGYALERIRTLFVDTDISDSFISFGDSSVLAMGNHPHGQGWKSGIRHHFRPEESLFTFTLIEESLSTSGTGHILDPSGGKGSEAYRNISVASADPVESEVLSTALIAADVKKQIEILKNFAACRALEVSYEGDGKPTIRELN
jgi:thiamine biosynthesis lipoprotein